MPSPVVGVTRGADATRPRFDPAAYQTPQEQGRTFVTTVVLDENDTESRVEAIPGMEVCDFCSDPDPSCSFEASTVLMGVTVVDGVRVSDVSEGDWAACEACATMVDFEDRDALVERSVERLLDDDPEMAALPRGAISLAIAKVQDAFWAARR